MAAVVQRAWGWYRLKLHQKPMRTQIVTSGVLWAAGDYVAQSIDFSMSRPPRQGEEEETKKTKLEIDWRRVSVSSSFGLTFVGPFGHLWYQGLDHVVKHMLKLKPNSLKFIGSKVLMDTFIFGPLHLVAFFSYMGLSSGRSLKQLKEDLRRDFLPAFMLEGSMWSAVQIINFRFLPVQHQLLFVNICCIVDSAFLSWFKHQENAPWKASLKSFIINERKP